MMRLFFKLLLCLGPAGALLVGIGLWVDPAYLFHQEGTRRMAQYMLEGKTVTNLYQHDKRLALRYYVPMLKERPEILSFGSSRAMVLEAEAFPGKRFFNVAMPAGGLEDLLACYEVFHAHGYKPDLVIVSPEAYWLNGTYPNELYLEEEYDQALRRLGLHELSIGERIRGIVDRRWWELISPSYYQQSAAKVGQLISKGRDYPQPTDEPMPNGRSLRPDGSLLFDRRERDRTPEQTEEMAKEYVAQRPRDFTTFPGTSSSRVNIFETFIQSLLDDGVKVEFLLPPFNPAAYTLIKTNRDWHMVGKTETYYREYAAKHGIPVYGSYDPAPSGATPADFYDGHHPRAALLKRIYTEGKAAAETGK